MQMQKGIQMMRISDEQHPGAIFSAIRHLSAWKFEGHELCSLLWTCTKRLYWPQNPSTSKTTSPSTAKGTQHTKEIQNKRKMAPWDRSALKKIKWFALLAIRRCIHHVKSKVRARCLSTSAGKNALTYANNATRQPNSRLKPNTTESGWR
jgi:hypothetical protein